MMKAVLSLLLIAPLAAQGMARVNDATSPGMLGDAKLSLDEAVRVVNGTLAPSALSAAERARIMGSGTPKMIEVDAAVTPMITLTKNLTAVAPAADFMVVTKGGVVTLNATGRDYGMTVQSNDGMVRGFMFRGGKIGMIADTSKRQVAGKMLQAMGLQFAAQTSVGLRLQANGTGKQTLIRVMGARFSGMPTAVQMDDKSNTGGRIMLMMMMTNITQVDLGFDVNIESGGQNHDAAGLPNQRDEQQAVASRAAHADQFAARDDDVHLGQLRDQRHPAAGRHAGATRSSSPCSISITAPSSPARTRWRRASGLRPAALIGMVRRTSATGDHEILAGRLNRRLWAWNNTFRDGTLTISNEGTRPSLRWNKFENMTIRATRTNRAQIVLTSSELRNVRLEGQSTVGDIALENCYTTGLTKVGSVSETNPAPSPWIAETSISTSMPKIGASVDLTIKLPAGMAATWFLAPADPALLLTEEPWRFYGLRTQLLHVPVIQILESTLRLPIPNNLSFVGQTIYAMPVSFPYGGQRHVPSFHLPPGQYMTFQK